MSDEAAPETEVKSPRVARGARVAKKAAPSRGGRPATGQLAAAATDGEEIGAGITRRSRRDGGTGNFDIPPHMKKPGWDYEWKTISVLGQPVDGAELMQVNEGGWRPTSAKDMAGLCPPGWKKTTIERYGMMLFMRPMRLTQEARQEDLDIAERQKSDKLRGAMVAGPDEDSRLTKRIVTDFNIEGEVGTHSQRSAA